MALMDVTTCPQIDSLEGGEECASVERSRSRNCGGTGGTAVSVSRTEGFALRLIEARKILFQIFQLGQIVVNDVRILGIVFQIILVVALGGVKYLEWLDLCDDLSGVNFRGIELCDIGLSDALLIFIGVEDRGTILGACIRTLAGPLRGIVCDGAEKQQELALGEVGRIVDDSYSFGEASN